MDYENINTEEFASCSEVATTQVNWPTQCKLLEELVKGLKPC